MSERGAGVAQCALRLGAGGAAKASTTLISALSLGSSLARNFGSAASVLSAVSASPRNAASQPW
jgi:hypothetical protein